VSWFPALLPITSGDPPDQRSWQMVPFYKGLADLPQETLLASWAGEPRIEDARFGRVEGPAAFGAYVTTNREWLALSDAAPRPLSVVATATRSVEEVVLQLEVGGERQELGAAIVAEWDDGHRLTAVRVYQDAWPRPNHLVEVPAPADGGTRRVPQLLRDLEQARAARDVDAVLSCYEEDAELCLFGAVPQLVHGRDQLRRLHATPEVAGSTARTTTGAVTDDGRTCAVEYRTAHGDAHRPDEVGLATYERGPHGRILRERRYRVPAGAHSGARTVAGFGPGELRPARGRVLESAFGIGRDHG